MVAVEKEIEEMGLVERAKLSTAEDGVSELKLLVMVVVIFPSSLPPPLSLSSFQGSSSRVELELEIQAKDKEVREHVYNILSLISVTGHFGANGHLKNLHLIFNSCTV